MSKEVQITPKDIAKAIEYLLDENEQLKVELQEANDNIIWWSNRFNAVERDNRQLKEDKKKVWEWVIYKQQHSIEPVISTDELDEILEILGDKENE